MATLPTIDFSDIDFEFRPVIAPVPPDEVDEDDPFSRYTEVAGINLGYAIYGDYMSVYCDVTDGTYTYFVADENHDQSDGPFGDKVSSPEDRPFTLLELIDFLESYWEGEPTVGLYIHTSLEEYSTFPIENWSDVTVESSVYPQLGEFYNRLAKHLIAWVNNSQEIPDQQTVVEVVNEVVEGIVDRR